MQTPPTFNDQHAWGGQLFRAARVPSPSLVPQEPTPLPAQRGEDVRPSCLHQGGVTASSSDNLFHPTSHVPSSHVDAPLRLCASKQEQRPNNEHWCSGVPATVELRQAKEKKHALVPGLSTREENWETRERNGTDDADRVRTNKNRELVEVRGRG